ncbi:MAG: hypothetical protein AAGE98_17515 [Actinomycetota bacterium]
MSDETVTPKRATVTQIFLLVTIGGSLVAIDVGYDYGAFETVNYRRIFPVFVFATVALLASFLTEGPRITDSRWTRAVLALPAIYLVADMLSFTDSKWVYGILIMVIVASLPFMAYVVARMADLDFFHLPRRLQIAAASTICAMFLAGWYVGANHPRFFECEDFLLAGDYVPENCTEQD